MDRVIVEYKDGRWEPVGITPPEPDNLGPLVRHVIAKENGAGYGTNERPVFVFRGLDAPVDESFLIFVKAWATSVWRTFYLGPELEYFYFTPAIPQPTDVAGAQRKVIEAENRLTEAWRLLEGVKRGSWAMRPDEMARIIRDNLEHEERDAPGLTLWVAARWDGPVPITGPTVTRWLADWRACTAACSR